MIGVGQVELLGRWVVHRQGRIASQPRERIRQRRSERPSVADRGPVDPHCGQCAVGHPALAPGGRRRSFPDHEIPAPCSARGRGEQRHREAWRQIRDRGPRVGGRAHARGLGYPGLARHRQIARGKRRRRSGRPDDGGEERCEDRQGRWRPEPEDAGHQRHRRRAHQHERQQQEQRDAPP